MRTRSEWLDLLTVAGFCAFLFFYGLVTFGLVGADEPRYAQIAREMLRRHDFIVPFLYGKPWLEKPALFYWMAAISYKIFGVSDWAARLPSAFLATLMIFAAYFHSRRFRPGAELNVALMTASSAALIGFSRSASTDMPLAAFFVVGMLAWYAWFADDRKASLAVFYLSMALATLAKGPVAPALAGLVIIAFAILEHDFRIVWRTLWLPGIVLFLAVALPWFVAVQLRIPGFFREFFLQHNLERFAVQNLYHRHQPFWYYVPVVLLAVMPWTVPFLAALVEQLRDFRKRTAADPHDPLPRFLVIWIVLVVGFFSLSQSKLPGYILPAIPPCTILAADWLQRRADAPVSRWVVLLHAATVATLTVAAMVAPFFVVAKHAGVTVAVPPPLKMFAVLIGVMVLLGVSLTIFFRGTPMLRFATLAPLIFGLGWLLRAGGPALDASLSSRPIAREVSQLAGGADRTVALFSPGHVTGESPLRELEYGLAFYLDLPIPEYDRGEVPADDHLVIARQGSQAALTEAVGGRRVSRLGDFPAQRLEFFWISPPPPPAVPGDHQHHH